MTPGKLHGQVAIVTGAGRGFGRAIALRLASEGAAVTLVARSQKQLEEVASEIELSSGKALVAAADARVFGQVLAAARLSAERFGPCSILVHAAGINGPFGPVWEVDPAEWWQAHEVHVRGAVHLAKVAVPQMISRGGGRIVNVASLAGTQVVPNVSAYSVSKGALIRVTEHIAAEGKDLGIAAFAIEPGTVVTDLLEGTIASPDARKWAPGFVRYLEMLKDRDDPAVGLVRCASFCSMLVSGAFDSLSGRYLTVDDDLAALARAVSA